MEQLVKKWLGEVDITVNGDKPYDIQIHDPVFYKKIALTQSVGAGDAYVEGLWDCDQLDEFFFRVCRSRLYNEFYSQLNLNAIKLVNKFINQQTPMKSEQVAKQHYNLGNNLFEKMLGKSLAYTCGYWKNATTLDEAEFAKYDLICRKLELKSGDKVLELACGLGGLAKYMAEKYDVEIVAIDIAEQPVKYARELCRNLPVKIYQCDYRSVDVYNPQKFKFDKIVSVGALEHIGYKNYKTFLKISRDFIKEDGLFLLHSIGSDVSTNYCDPWINKYIFPNGMLPSLKQLGEAFENLFVVEDFQNFGAYYDKTLLAWNENLNKHWPELKNQYDEKFHRLMNYYLLSCAGCFRARGMQLWQFVLSPNGKLGGYDSIR